MESPPDRGLPLERSEHYIYLATASVPVLAAAGLLALIILALAGAMRLIPKAQTDDDVVP